MTEDTYYTVNNAGEGLYKEKMSRFLAFACHVSTEEEAKTLIKGFQNKYHDSRHVCWAYVISPDESIWQLNDNGEPSGTAGKPILGQIRSFGLTDTLVIVVRYFGGIKLGTSGLISAYREAARCALEDAGKQECHKTVVISIEFPYISADSVMKTVKNLEIPILSKQFDNLCKLKLEIRQSMLEEIKGRLLKIEGLVLDE